LASDKWNGIIIIIIIRFIFKRVTSSRVSRLVLYDEKKTQLFFFRPGLVAQFSGDGRHVSEQAVVLFGWEVIEKDALEFVVYRTVIHGGIDVSRVIDRRLF